MMRRLAVLLTSVSIALLSVAAIPAQAGVVPARVHLNALPASFLPTCTPQSAINRMVSYIRTQQQPDGSFPSIGQASTANAVNALVFSGVNPSTVTRDGHSAIDWIYSQTGSLDSTGVAAEFLLALLLAGRSTVAPNGFDYTARVANAYDPATGLYDPNPTGNAYALIALRAAGRPVPPHAAERGRRVHVLDLLWRHERLQLDRPVHPRPAGHGPESRRLGKERSGSGQAPAPAPGPQRRLPVQRRLPRRQRLRDLPGRPGSRPDPLPALTLPA